MSEDLPRHEPRPRLFDPLLAAFQPTPFQRRTGRLLIALVRIPGALAVLRAWHARQARRG